MDTAFRTFSLPRARVWVPAVAILFIMGLAARDAAQAASPRTAANGLILFQAHVGRYNQLFTIKPDGSGLKQITKIPFTGDTDGAEQADWSPDGRTIAFDAPSRKGGETIINLFTVEADGTGLAELPLAVPGFNESFLLAGRQLDRIRPGRRGLGSDRARDLVAHADGSDPHRLTRESPPPMRTTRTPTGRPTAGGSHSPA